MIRFKCPKCSEIMEAPAGMHGEFLNCPQCQQVVQVPQASPSKSAPKGPKPSTSTVPSGPKIVDTDVIRFHCDCGQAVSTHSRNAGKIGECPVCQRDVPIPKK